MNNRKQKAALVCPIHGLEWQFGQPDYCPLCGHIYVAGCVIENERQTENNFSEFETKETEHGTESQNQSENQTGGEEKKSDASFAPPDYQE